MTLYLQYIHQCITQFIHTLIYANKIIINPNQAKKNFVKSQALALYALVYMLAISDWHVIGYTEQTCLVPGAHQLSSARPQ